MSQGAADWYIRKPFILAVLGTSLSAGRLSGNLWWQRLMVNARAQPEAVGPVVLQNFAKGSQTSVYGVDTAPLIADFNPTHVLTEGFAINDSAFGISRPDHLANMLTIRNILKAKNPEVDITWQTMNGVSTSGMALRPELPEYYQDEIDFADLHGDRMLDHYNGLPSPPAPAGGWPKPLPEYMTDSNDGLHPIWEGALEVYFWPGMIYWLRCRMAEWWGLPIPNPPEPPTPPDAEYLVVAGGGGGAGYVGAGGGAGGRRRGAAYLEQLFGPVLIGKGGDTSGSGVSGGDGTASALAYGTTGEIRAEGGGGGGGAYGLPGRPGGSGGGSNSNTGAGDGIPGQGNPGGTNGNAGANGGKGGGGGAGGPGGNGNPNGGLGGLGVAVDVPGFTHLTICGGGPGSVYSGGTRPAYPAGGGPTNFGGGGQGGGGPSNTGPGDPGGPGVAWVWYPGEPRAVGGTMTSFGGFTVHQFTLADFPVKMTADNAPAGNLATASTQINATWAPWKAFDQAGAVNNGWGSANGVAPPHWLRRTWSAPQTWGGYTIQAVPTSGPQYAPKSWTLRGSNDGVVWDVLDTRLNQPNWTGGEIREFPIANPGAYTMYEILVTATEEGTQVRICELSFTPALAPL
jgi:hypothetical protein